MEATWKRIFRPWACWSSSVASVCSRPLRVWLQRWPSIGHALDTHRQKRQDQRAKELMGVVSSSWLGALRVDEPFIGTNWQADKLQRGRHD